MLVDGDRRWVIFRRARFAFDDLVFADEDGIAFSGFVGLGSSGTVTTSARLAKIRKACPGLVVGNGYTLPIARLTAGVGTMSNAL
jgi:hypothetical protein